MKRISNHFLVGIRSRVAQLKQRLDESRDLAHDATKGNLREGYLADFIKSFVPHGLSASPGFVIDCHGQETSPQLDLILFDARALPYFDASSSVAVVPIEIVLSVIEVKSNLKTDHFEQVRRQQASFRRMRFAWPTADRKLLTTVPCEGVSQTIFAYESDVAASTIRSWFDQESALEVVCVMGQHCHMRDPGTHGIEVIEAGDAFPEMMHFLVRLQTDLAEDYRRGATMRFPTPDGDKDFVPDLGLYFTFDAPPE